MKILPYPNERGNSLAEGSALGPTERSQLCQTMKSLAASIEQNRRTIESARKELDLQAALLAEIQAIFVPLPVSPPAAAKRGRSPSPLYVRVIECARRYMIEAGRPLNRREILDRMLAEREVLAVGDPAHFVGKVLWGSDQFAAFKEGYWPSDQTAPVEATPSGRKRKPLPQQGNE